MIQTLLMEDGDINLFTQHLELVDGGRTLQVSGDEEGALVVLLLEQHTGKGKAHTRKRLRLGNDVRLDTGFLEGEILARAAAARLDVVDDQQRTKLLGEAGNALHPFFRGSVEAAFALNGLEDEGCGGIDT